MNFRQFTKNRFCVKGINFVQANPTFHGYRALDQTKPQLSWNMQLFLLCHIRIDALDPRFRGDDEAENPLKKGNRHSRKSGNPEATNSELEM